MKKSFDATAWMRKRREEIDREDAGLTWEERQHKTLEVLKNDPLWQHLKQAKTGLSIPGKDRIA